MEDRTRNILIAVVVTLGVIGAGGALFAPKEGAGPIGPGASEHAQARKLMEEGRFGEAQAILRRLAQQYPGRPVAERARADQEFGIPYYQALALAKAGQTAQAQAILRRVAQAGGQTEWAAKANVELARLGQQPPGPPGAPGATGPPPGQPPQQADRQTRLAQANSLLNQGRNDEARAIFQALVEEDANDDVASTARLALATLQAAAQAVRQDPQVNRARVALHRVRASLLAFRGATGQFPPTLQTPGLERYGFSYEELLADVQRIEVYRAEPAGRFELIAVARDARGTRLRATEQSVEDMP